MWVVQRSGKLRQVSHFLGPLEDMTPHFMQGEGKVLASKGRFIEIFGLNGVEWKFFAF